VKASNLPKAHQTGHQSHAAAKSPCDQVCFIPNFAVLGVEFRDVVELEF
jgi:hypothetical protein